MDESRQSGEYRTGLRAPAEAPLPLGVIRIAHVAHFHLQPPKGLP